MRLEVIGRFMPIPDGVSVTADLCHYLYVIYKVGLKLNHSNSPL